MNIEKSSIGLMIEDGLKLATLRIYVVFTTDKFFEAALESWPEWDLNSRPLNSVQTL